jgi:hypothetical protein
MMYNMPAEISDRSNMPEETAAHKAIEVTRGRQQMYGHPAEVTAKVAPLWSAYLGVVVKPKDVALLMLLYKIGREMNRHKEDNLVDAHGYLLVYERILKREAGVE